MVDLVCQRKIPKKVFFLFNAKGMVADRSRSPDHVEPEVPAPVLKDTVEDVIFTRKEIQPEVPTFDAH
jgi:hypothetical protein